MTLSTPCYNAEADGKLLGVASVDFTVSDIFASAEYFTQGDLSYAFVIDRDGLVLLHPLLPFPSTISAAVYLDISTLEPQPGFEFIRESMIKYVYLTPSTQHKVTVSSCLVHNMFNP